MKRYKIYTFLFFMCCALHGYLKPELFKADVSFMVADLKVSQDAVKILEFGDATWSGFRGLGYIYGRGAGWQFFWDFIQTLGLPVFLVGKVSPEEKALHECSMDKQCRFCPSISDLYRDPLFKQLFRSQLSSTTITKKSVLSSYKAIVIFDRYRSVPEHLFFAQKFPNLLVLNEAIHPSAQYKHLTHQLFDTDELRVFRPRCGVYPRQYTSDLAQTIIQEVQTEQYYVVKPAYASQGHGVLMVHKDELDTVLKFILQSTDNMSTQQTFHVSQAEFAETYGFWLKPTKNTCFIVEEFVPSKELIVRGQAYDPTMRVLFVPLYNNGVVSIQFLGAYWKRPAKSLTEQASFREQHLSKIPRIRPADDIVQATKVSDEDLLFVTDTLRPALETLYHKMLTVNYYKKDDLIARCFYGEELDGED